MAEWGCRTKRISSARFTTLRLGLDNRRICPSKSVTTFPKTSVRRKSRSSLPSGGRSATEFAGPDDDGVFQPSQAAQVFRQGRTALIHRAHPAVLAVNIVAVCVPVVGVSAVVKLHATDAALNESARDQALLVETLAVMRPRVVAFAAESTASGAALCMRKASS